MARSARRPWTWEALGLWLVNGLLVLAIGAGLLLGPLLADRAWSQGAHVTPAQAALHFALIADGHAHHHQQSDAAPAARSSGASLQSSASGMSWGTPVSPTARPEAPACPPLLGCARTTGGESMPASVELTPATPPPEAA